MIRVLELASSLLLAAASLMVILNVFLRYLFNAPIFGSDDVVLLLILWMSFIGMVVVQKDDGHFKMTLLLASLSPVGRKRLQFVIDAIGILTLAAMVYSSFLLWETYSRSVQISLGISKSVYAAAAIFGSVGMFVMSITRILAKR